MATQSEPEHTPEAAATQVSSVLPADVAPTPVALDHVQANESIRSSAKWVIAASASVTAVLITGLQLSQLTSTSGNVAKAIGSGCFIVAIFSTGAVLLRAARVLVLSPVTLSVLSELERKTLEAQLASVEDGKLTPEEIENTLGVTAVPLPESGPMQGSPIIATIPTGGRKIRHCIKIFFYGSEQDPCEYINSYREVLASLGITRVIDLLILYCGKKPQALESLTHEEMPSRARIEASVQQIVTYVQLMQAKRRYDILVSGISRFGVLLSVAIMGFVFIASGSQAPADPRISEPIPVKVNLLTGECGQITLDGSAVAGTLKEPEVLIEPRSVKQGKGSSSVACPSGLLKITPKIGIVLYGRN
ncbi:MULTISPECIES: hypothetical protein [unclassified Streptomyces]|uniref:Uncharacterized protein n=1 Tax=Streptomyces sp. NBC_00060 TaxID=2975636 RepID=A0AAU2H232_9ACTN